MVTQWERQEILVKVLHEEHHLQTIRCVATDGLESIPELHYSGDIQWRVNGSPRFVHKVVIHLKVLHENKQQILNGSRRIW